MSNTIQYKLLTHEVTPPAGVWFKIADELDESAIAYNFPSRLKHHAVPPPATTWQKIAASLATDGFSNSLAEKLGQAEATPPAHTWNNIKMALEAEHEAAVPEHRFFSPLLKYAAAAAITGLMIFGGIKLFSGDKQNDSDIAGTGIITPSTNNNLPVITTPSLPGVNSETAYPSTASAAALAEEKRNDAALEASKKTFARLDLPGASKLRQIASGYHFASMQNDNDPAPTTNDLSSRYITVTMPDCNVVRMSKKMEHFTCCVSGEMIDKNCINQVEKWRQRLACSPAGHPANFMDILDLVDVLGDE